MNHSFKNSILLISAMILPSLALAEQSADELAKATANPVAAMISLPLQSNWENGYGTNNAVKYTMNVQPVIPFQLNDDWNLISRTIVPLVNQPELVSGQGSISGVGDSVASLFFSPRAASNVIWGVGPVFLVPTASNDRLGADKWGAGPTGVILVQEGKWTYGVLANHLWSFAGGDANYHINLSYLNPFATYSLGKGWSATTQAELNYDWSATHGNHSTVPLTVSVARVLTVGNQPMSLGMGFRHYVETPNGTPNNGVRLSVTFLFPK